MICVVVTWLFLGAVANAEERRIESPGAVAILVGVPDAIAPRDAAIDEAIVAAVNQVAAALIEEEAERQRLLASTMPPDANTDATTDANTVRDPDASKPGSENEPGEEPEEPNFRVILGKKMEIYTSRYRMLEDRGEGPAIFTADPEATTEYVVVLEVFIDVGPVRRKLVRAGLLPAGGESVMAGRVRIEVEGLVSYPGYLALRTLLQDDFGAISVVPVEMERGRALLEVETADDPQGLLDKITRFQQADLEIVPLVPDGADLRLAVNWTPLLPDDLEGEGAIPGDAEDVWALDSEDSGPRSRTRPRGSR